MKKKKLLYRSVVGILLSTVLATGTPVTILPGLKAIPILSDTSITAEAASKCYSIENTTLILQNKVKATTIKELKNKDQITKIVASEGTIMPESCSSLFAKYKNVTSIDLSKADTSKVKSMKNMFLDLDSLVELNISGIDTSNVTNMQAMFRGCKKLTQLDVSSFNTTKVTDMSYMFDECQILEKLDLRNFNTSKVTNMSFMFERCCRLPELDLRSFNTSKVTDMSFMFQFMYNAEKIDVSSFNTSNVTNMTAMFEYCTRLKSLDLSNFDTRNVTLMISMFSDTESLEELDLRSFKTTKVVNMECMFRKTNLKKLDLSSFNTANTTNKDYMFSGSEISILTLGPKFKKIPKAVRLPNGKYGWAMGSLTSERISGEDTYAVFTNKDTNTYYKIAKLEGTYELIGKDNPTFGEQIHLMINHLEECPYDELQFKWYRDDVLIPDANDNVYVCSKEDIGKIITCIATDRYGIYKGEFKESTTVPVQKAKNYNAPKNLVGYDASERGASDGKITGVDTTMEYATDWSFSDAKPCTSTTISNLKKGTYYIRYKETQTHKPSYASYVNIDDKTPLKGTVKIEGIPKYGQTLSTVIDDFPTNYRNHHWKRNGEYISGATDWTYQLTKEDIGQTITCEITDGLFVYKGAIESKPTPKIAKADGPAAPTGLKGVAISKKGASDGKITGVKTTMEYASKTDFSDKKTCTTTTITGLKAGTYYVRVAETDTTKAGASAKVTVADIKAAISGKVAISGTLKYGQTLTVKVSDSNASKFTYQWKRGSSAISGATASTYKLVKADIGQVISCVVKDASENTTGSLSGKTSAKIVKADGPAAPTGLNGVAPTKKGGSDGQIVGVKTTMEYSTKSDFSANVVACTSTTIKNLKTGTYYVRIKETETTYGSKATKVVVPEGADPIDNKNDVTKIFKDVKAGEWYVSAIQFVYDRKYMNGVSSNLFGTNTAITREQFVTVLYNIEGQPSVKYRKVFNDVADKQFYSKTVIWAYDNKITKGISDTVFGTGNNISREQLATMLYNYSQYKKFKSVAKNKDLSSFPDYKKVSSWAKEGMTWAVSNGVVNGKASNDKNYLDPAGKATRAECAQMVKNLFDKVIKK